MSMETDKGTTEVRLELTYDHGTGRFKPYFDGLLTGQAIASNCQICGRTWFPPRAVCPDDQAETSWISITGSGVVLGATTTRTKLPFTPAADVYTFVLVKMDGTENAVFGRMRNAAADVDVGTGVDLVAPVGVPAHPAQAAQFVVKGE